MFLGKLVKSWGQKTPRLKSYRKKLHRGGKFAPPPGLTGLTGSKDATVNLGESSEVNVINVLHKAPVCSIRSIPHQFSGQ